MGNQLLDYLKQCMQQMPSPVLIIVARVLMDIKPRSALPDWVEILANGDPDRWQSVIEIALDDIAAEEEPDGSSL